MKQIIYLGGKKAAEHFLREKYKLVDFANLTINGHPWIELMEEYAKESATTPPDVEQLRSDLVDILYECNGTGAGADDVVKYLISKGLQAGQSAVQDATPQEEVWVENKITDSGFAVCKYNDDEGRWQPYYDVEKVNLSTIRSELSAAQAEAKALSAIKKGLEASLTEAQEENKRLQGYLYGPTTPPESGEQTK